jgi:hypothetical protein
MRAECFANRNSWTVEFENSRDAEVKPPMLTDRLRGLVAFNGPVTKISSDLHRFVTVRHSIARRIRYSD